MKLICTDHLSKRAGGRLVLEDVSLEISTASVTAIFGRSGAGKSTLLKSLAGLSPAPPNSITREAKIKSSFAFNPPALAGELSVVENLSLFAALGRVPSRRRTNRIAHIIQELSLAPYRNIRADALPSGTAARVEIARALVGGSHVVFIDGLLDNMDHHYSDGVWRTIQALRREEGTAFVIATIRAEYADRCDTAVVLHNGRTIAAGPSAELKSKVQANTVVVDAIKNPLIKSKIKKNLVVTVEEADGALKFESADPLNEVMDLLAEYGSEVGAVYLRQPTLDDVLDAGIAGDITDD